MSQTTPKARALAVAMNMNKAVGRRHGSPPSGRGLVAERIVALARENDIVIEANPVLAEALSGVEIDDTIPIELYESVAVVIGFVLKIKRQ